MFGFGPTEEWPGIAKLTEEIGELGQVIGKLMMVHGSENHWSGPLRPMLLDEMADVEAALAFVRRHNLTLDDKAYVTKRVADKTFKFEAWHRGEA